MQCTSKKIVSVFLTVEIDDLNFFHQLEETSEVSLD